MIEKKNGDCLDASTFREQIPQEVYDLICSVGREGFIPCLVGGAIRDYLLTGRLPKDFDFEIKHIYEYDQKEWTFRLNRLGERLREIYNYKVEYLSFHILRIELTDHTVEIAPARVEVYDQDKKEFGHSDFNVELISNPPYSESFKRRDLTINALGVEFGAPMAEDEFKLIDPYGGCDHLYNKTLTHCSDDFFKDPVRLLRLIRFHLKFGFELDFNLKNSLVYFHLGQLTHYYFFRESLKSDFLTFHYTFFSWCRKFGINLPEHIAKLSFLGSFSNHNVKILSAEQALMYIVFNHEVPSDEEIEYFVEAATLKKSLFKDFQFLKEILERLDGFKKEKFIEKLSNCTLDEALELEELVLIKSLVNYINKHDREELAKIGSINSHLYATFLKVEEVLGPRLVGKPLFDKILKEGKVEEKKRGVLLLYCHFKEFLFS